MQPICIPPETKFRRSCCTLCARRIQQCLTAHLIKMSQVFQPRGVLLEHSYSQPKCLVLWGTNEPAGVRCDVLRRYWSMKLNFLLSLRGEVRGHGSVSRPGRPPPRQRDAAVELCSIILHLQAQVWVQLLRLIKCPQTLSPEQQLNHIWLRVFCVCVCEIAGLKSSWQLRKRTHLSLFPRDRRYEQKCHKNPVRPSSTSYRCQNNFFFF